MAQRIPQQRIHKYTKATITYKQQIFIKGENYEKNNYIGHGFGYAADIYWRMLGRTG